MLQQVEEYIVNILREEMEIPQNNIWISSQNRKIPPNSQDLFCVVGTVGNKVLSSKSKYDPSDDSEVQVVYTRTDVQIDLFSRSNEARLRRDEVLMSLNSFYSKELQDKYAFRIFELPRYFSNTSQLEGGSDINRFTIIVPTLVGKTKKKTTAYYDTFDFEIWTEKDKIIGELKK